MKNFSDFNIKVETTNFTGDKIKISRILNIPIVVHDFKLKESIHFPNDCLHLQIEYKGEMHICFSGSKTLIEQIKKVPSESFPFKATITQEDERYMFK